MLSTAFLRLSPWSWLRLSEGDRRGTLFLGMWLFIACVSVHDGYLVAMYRDVIAQTECNPLGQHLLELGDGEIWYLLGAKAAGTIFACSALLVLFWHSPRLGSVVAASLASFQFWLLVHLTFF
jgi:hypothetical protein